jgi:hypothetical protein
MTETRGRCAERNKPSVRQAPVYEIRVKGHLDSPHWSEWFDGLTLTLTENGETILSGPVADQSALHGLLSKVRDLGLPLVSVNQVEATAEDDL